MSRHPVSYLDGIDSPHSLVCTFCGHVHGDAEEREWQRNGDTVDVECEECGKPFTARRTVSVTYTSYDREGLQ